MVRGIDIQNVVANTQFVTREQQIAQQQANFAPAHAAQEGQKTQDVHKEQVRQSRQPEQDNQAIDPNRRQALIRRRRRRRRGGGGSPPSAEAGEQREEGSAAPGGKGHVIDLEA